MVNPAQVKNWIDSNTYKEALHFLTEKFSLKIREEEIPDALLIHDANKFNAAKIQPSDLFEIATKTDSLCKYFSQKNIVIQGTENEQEGKSTEEDEDDIVLSTNAFYPNFLNLYLLELYFLNHAPGDLEGYLKAIRIPNSKKYASQLRSAYKAVD